MPLRFYCHNGILVIWWQQQFERRGASPEVHRLLVIKPHWGETRALAGSPKIRALIEINCVTICWTLWFQPVSYWYVFCFSGCACKVSVQDKMWWNYQLLWFLWAMYFKKGGGGGSKVQSNLWLDTADRCRQRFRHCDLISAWTQSHLAVDVGKAGSDESFSVKGNGNEKQQRGGKCCTSPARRGQQSLI